MKKILLTLAVFLAAMNMVAQEHLTFKGIPIEGSMSEFCQKLEAKGFTPIEQDEDHSVLSGDFTGKEVSVLVSATDDGKNVFSVLVLFEPIGEWNFLVSSYNYYKDLYTHKYGEPAISKEKNPALSDSNTDLMLEVQSGTVEYISTWVTTGGEIYLSINKSKGILKGMVTILYRDSQNANAKFQNDLDDI